MRSTDFRSIVEPILNEEFNGIYDQRADEWAQVFKEFKGIPRNYHEEPVLYGFGAAAHILIQVARHQGREIYAFTREGDIEAQEFALGLGAKWAGDSKQDSPVPLDGAIIFAPAGELVPQALRAVRKGGRVVCAGIHMSDIPSFPYDILWGEREICSVANLTRRDGDEFLPLAAQIPINTTVHTYSLEQANEALDDLRNGRFSGAAVLVP